MLVLQVPRPHFEKQGSSNQLEQDTERDKDDAAADREKKSDREIFFLFFPYKKILRSL